MPEGLEQIMALSSQELIKWCRERKKTLGLSNHKLAERSNVPIGTIDRIMSGNYSEYKYSSIQPILSVLIEFNKDTPEPEPESESQPQYYYETIEGYKLIVENKNQIIKQAKTELQQKNLEIAYLKEENKHKQEALDRLQEHLCWMEKLIDRQK